MKYNTKSDYITSKKHKEKQEKKEEELVSGYTWVFDIETAPEGTYWRTRPFYMLYGERKKGKPVRNFYKEIVRLNRYVESDTN